MPPGCPVFGVLAKSPLRTSNYYPTTFSKYKCTKHFLIFRDILYSWLFKPLMELFKFKNDLLSLYT